MIDFRQRIIEVSKKKTPQEKKEAAYEKDHYAFPWKSPHGFRKTWKKKKSHVNRVVRRKSRNLLHQVEKRSCEKLGPEEESLTAELFRKGLSRKKLRKIGVVSLQEKIDRKREYRESSFDIKARSHARRTDGFRRFVNRLLDDKEYSDHNLLHLSRLANFSHFQNFLDEEPSWIPRLEQWIQSARKRTAWRQSKVQHDNFRNV
jgi:hypothetical protein